MTFDKLYCIQYPSGSFGHFIYLVLSYAGKGFASIDVEVQFNTAIKSGSSHFITSQIQKYYDTSSYEEYAKNRLIQDYTKVTGSGNLTGVIIDSGVNNDSLEFMNYFPGAPLVRVCYDDYSWPLAIRSFFGRCMSEVLAKETHILDFIKVDPDRWQSSERWEQREKCFLLLKDNELRKLWKPVNNALNIDITSILDYQSLYNHLSSILSINEFKSLHDKFYESNLHHFEWFTYCTRVLDALKTGKVIDLSMFSEDLYSQATINYYIYLVFSFEVPAWDYREWFKSTGEIFQMIDQRS